MRKDAITTPEALSICSQLAAGTTAKADDYSVLWLGEKLALVHFKAGSFSDGRGGGYCSPWLDRVLISRPTAYLYKMELLVPACAIASNVHDCDQDKDGRLTKAKLAALIADAQDIEERWDQLIAADQEAAARLEQKKAAEIRAKNTGPGTYRVTWTIDLEADASGEDAVRQVAKQALAIQRDPQSIATQFTVCKRGGGRMHTVDFHDEEKTTIG